MHGQYAAGDELAVLSDTEVPGFYPHHVVKHELQVQASLYTHLKQFQGQETDQVKPGDKTCQSPREQSCAQTHLCEHGLSVLGDHGALIAVKGDKVVVERLLGMLQHVVELSGTTLKYTSEIPWNQRPAYC